MPKLLKFSHKKHEVQIAADFKMLNGSLAAPEGTQGILLFAQGMIVAEPVQESICCPLIEPSQICNPAI